MAKINTLSMNNTAEKTIPFGAAHTYIACIREYPTPGYKSKQMEPENFQEQSRTVNIGPAIEQFDRLIMIYAHPQTSENYWCKNKMNCKATRNLNISRLFIFLSALP